MRFFMMISSFDRPWRPRRGRGKPAFYSSGADDGVEGDPVLLGWRHRSPESRKRGPRGTVTIGE